MRLQQVFLCGVAVIALVPGLASAQTARGSQADPAATAVEDVVVTARRVEERLQDIPVAVTAIGAESLRQQQVGQMSDLAARAPNLAVTANAGDSQGAVISIRGQGAANILLTTDSSVGLYVDNVNVPRTIGIKGALLDIQRVEVLRGPQGTLYGRNTTGGALSIISQNPKLEPGASIAVQAGNYDAYQVEAVVNVPLSETWGARLAVLRSEHSGYGYSRINGRETNDENMFFLRGKLRGDIGRATVTLAVDHQRSRMADAQRKLVALQPGSATQPDGLGLTRALARYLYGTPLTAPANDPSYAAAINVLRGYMDGDLRVNDSDYAGYSAFDGTGVNLTVSLPINDEVTFTSLTGYRKFFRAGEQELDAVPFPEGANWQTATDEFYSQEFQLTGGSEVLNWVLGAYGSYEDGLERNLGGPSVNLLTPGNPTAVFKADVTSESLAAFGQANWAFATDWKLTLGLRYTQEKKGIVTYNGLYSRARDALGNDIEGQFFDTFALCLIPTDLRDPGTVCQATLEDTFRAPTWLVSLDHRLSEDALVYGKVSRGFRGGGQNFRGTNRQGFLPFAPEYVTEYEVGAKTEWFNRRVRINVAAFHTAYEDVQRNTVTVDPLNPTQTAFSITNAAAATLHGFEVEGTWRVTPAFALNLAAGYTKAQYDEFTDVTGDRTGEPWPTPDFVGNLGATYVIPTAVGEVHLGADYSYRSEQLLYPAAPASLRSAATQEGLGLLNARASLKIDSLNAEVAIFGRNITDEDYAVSAFAAGQGAAHVFKGDPRTFGIEFRRAFGGER